MIADIARALRHPPSSTSRHLVETVMSHEIDRWQSTERLIRCTCGRTFDGLREHAAHLVAELGR